VRRSIVILTGLFVLGFLGAESAAARVHQGVFSGYSSACLVGREQYKMIPLIYRVGYEFSERWELNLEPYAGNVYRPHSGWELGVPLFIRWNQPLFKKWGFFLDAGAGPLLLGTSTREQGKRFNFVDQLGLGLKYGRSGGVGFEVGGRFRHVSNAGLNDMNAGIDGFTVHAGITF
jgi:hypothetical protein